MSTSEEVETLVEELIATGTMNPDTLEDLNRFADEARAGTLHPDDLAYLQALHARILALPMPDTVAEAPEHNDGRFDEIRRRFAERYDPETGTSGLDAATRAAVYNEFWTEFEAVERR